MTGASPQQRSIRVPCASGASWAVIGTLHLLANPFTTMLNMSPVALRALRAPTPVRLSIYRRLLLRRSGWLSSGPQ